MLTFSFSGSVQGENPAEIAELFHALVDNPKLNLILAEIKKNEIQQGQVDAIFNAVKQNKTELEAALDA